MQGQKQNHITINQDFLKQKQDELYFKYKKIIYDDLSDKNLKLPFQVIFYFGLFVFISWMTSLVFLKTFSIFLFFSSLLLCFYVLNKKTLRTKERITQLFLQQYNQDFFKYLQINENEKVFFKTHFEENKHKTMEVAGVKDYVFGLNLIKDKVEGFLINSKEDELLNSAKNKLIAGKIRHNALKKSENE